MQYYRTTYKLHNLFYDEYVEYTFKEKFTENSFNRQTFRQTPAGQKYEQAQSVINLPTSHVLHIH